jgi:hypothetical protein
MREDWYLQKCVSLPGPRYTPFWILEEKLTIIREIRIPQIKTLRNTKNKIGNNTVDFLSFLDWGETQSTWYVSHYGLLYQSQMLDDDDNDCRAISGMRIGRGNQSTQRKLAPVPLCPPQIPHDLTRAWTWAAMLGSWWLRAWAMPWPKEYCSRMKCDRIKKTGILKYQSNGKWSVRISLSWWKDSVLYIPERSP